MAKRLIFVLLSLFFFVGSRLAAEDGTRFSRQSFGRVYSLEIPKYMSRTAELNDNADLQYANGVKEAYFIVMVEDKEFLNIVQANFAGPDDYFDYFYDNFNISRKKILTKIKTNINGMDAVLSEIEGGVDSLDFYYLIGVAESKSAYYNVICWTLYDKREELKNDYKKIIYSLKEEERGGDE